jgi:uncharacterized protein YciI
MKKLIMAFLLLSFFSGASLAQDEKKSAKKKQFIYVLKLIPRLLKEENWTERDNQIVGRHFKRLQQLQKDGRLILAGRTLTTDESGMGIVILQVDTEAEARDLMESDDAVKEKIMTARLYPFSVALLTAAKE